MVAARPKLIPAKWRKLFKRIPGYNPMEQSDGYYFDADAAQQPIDFFAECIKHAKGTRETPVGAPFVLESWQQAVTGCLFGWKDNKTKLRRYRECLLYVGKKNGKSAWVAGLILYMLTCDGEKGAEIYSAASSRDQAAMIFSHAVGMVRQESTLSNRLTVFGGKGGSVQKAIVYDDILSAYKCLAADANTVDGANPHFNAIDEVHRHKSPELADVLVRSTAARAQPLTVYTTTADYNRESLCNSLRKRAIAVRDNGGDRDKLGYDPQFLPVIYEAALDDDYMNPMTWAKANPNLGTTIPLDVMARWAKLANESPTELNKFLRLNLNIVTDADVAWLSMDKWDACNSGVGSLVGRECYGGLDLSSTTDVSAFVLMFPGDDGGYSVLPFFWIPERKARDRADRDRVPYDVWARDGLIETTPGAVIDYSRIRAKINELGDIYNIREIAADRWNATHIITNLTGDGFEIVPFGQGYASMTAPTKELETLILSGKLRHGGDPVLRWMAGNVMVETDAVGNAKPSKKVSTEKIDGIVAAIMALGRAMVAENTTSVYSRRGVLTV